MRERQSELGGQPLFLDLNPLADVIRHKILSGLHKIRRVTIECSTACGHKVQSALRSAHSREAVRAPAFAAHPVMHEEEAFRIVLILHGEQSRVVRSPE